MAFEKRATICAYVAPEARKVTIRFRSTTLFLAVSLIALPLAVIAWWMRGVSMCARVARDVVDRGGMVAYQYNWDRRSSFRVADRDPPGPEWMRKLFGTNVMSSLALVHGSRDTTDTDLAAWTSACHEVKTMWLPRTNVTDAGMRSLEKCVKLEDIDLSFTAITDDGLRQIARIRTLRSLKLTNTRISDQGMECLRNLRLLNELHLAGTQITSKGIECIRECHNLVYLDISRTRVDGNASRELKGLASLRNLLLDDTLFDDDGVRSLKDLKELQILSLSGTNITEACFESLEGLPKLEGVRLYRNALSEDRLLTLEEAMPSTVFGF